MSSQGIEILCIGSELLLGNILNSNAKWLAEELAVLGLPHFRQTVIGDNFIRLKNLVIETSQRSRILITTGGLGPTPDDLTTETIAAAFNTQLVKNDEIWLDIKKKFIVKDFLPTPNNEKQAFIPIGAQVIPNPSGTAPGIIWSPTKNFTIITLPGVPLEMKKMWIQTVVPWLQENIEINSTFISKTLHFAGITESKLAEDLKDLLNNENPTVAPYASIGEVKLRITAKAKNFSEAQKLITPIENKIRQVTGFKYFGSDEESLASVVIELLRQRGEKLTLAESCTGGGISAALTSIPGSSDVFLGGVIAYNNSIKIKLLNVSESLIKKYGAVSVEVVEAMAKGVLKKFDADWSIAVSGLAGPGGETVSKPIGLVHMCISGPFGEELCTESFNPKRGRTCIQKLSVLKSLDQLRLFLLNKS
ncbi:competence/damage-inducible protein A [Prochlorococcus sp. MIT 1223]|uniref:competence/damage-inducible protein A n=1 Tax=Prochlorococcus sp. MIT 1223 TaxID=3096217 RepID=UPI002A74B07A|nr:competence/damage-inducible protein A [Prochlorococcus sp. MIT 1223]